MVYVNGLKKEKKGKAVIAKSIAIRKMNRYAVITSS